MKVGDLVILEYEGVDLKEKERLKIGIVKKFSQNIGLFKVLWCNGDEKWCLQEHLEVVNEER
jgi:hypothetical protein